MIKSQSKRTLCVKLSASIAAVGVLLSAGVASAQTADAALGVGATVAANCTIATAPVAFGTYDSVDGPQVDLNGSVTVACTLGEVVAITLGEGATPGLGSLPEAPIRRMDSVADPGDFFLSYQLFTAVGRTVVWGNTPATSVAHTGTGTEVAVTVFGRLPAEQNVPVGDYSDTVLATVTF